MNSSDRSTKGLILFICFIIAGCGGGRDLGPTVKLSGKVTLDNEPFSEAHIWFISPKSGAGFETKLEPDGTYSISIEDAQIGETYHVFFSGVVPEGEQVDGAGAPVGPTPPPIPSKYWDGSTSELEAKIDGSQDQEFDFDLKSE